MLVAAGWTTPAGAADWIVPSEALTAYNWTGFYVGINGGGIRGQSSWTSNDPVTGFTTGNFDLWGGLFGATAGYNLHNMGSIVLGEEVDLGWTKLHGSTSNLCMPDCETVSTFLGTARLRLGYAFDRYLPYLTGGIAFGDINARFAGAPFGTDGTIRGGLVLGGGVELVVIGPVSAKFEYLHVQFGSWDCYTACGGGPISVKLEENIVRAGVNVRLWTR